MSITAKTFRAVVAIVVILGQSLPLQARPSVGHAGGRASGPAGGRAGGHTGGNARPRPSPSMGRPATASRPQASPARPGGVAGGQAASRPTPNFQRPSLGTAGRPNPGRPSLPNASGQARPTTRPAPAASPPRPGIGGNRPGIGDNNFWNSGTAWNSGNSSVWNNRTNNSINQVNNVGINAGGWRNPVGWGYGGGAYGGRGGNWANAWNTGYVNPRYNGWYNGCWTGNWGNWWTPFALGAATWGLGYSSLGYAGGAYVNPYYSAVATAPYDYSQPIVVNNYIPADQGGVVADQAEQLPAEPANETDSLVDAAREKFRAGDYVGALAGFDQVLRKSPNDSVIHEVRALTLFALGRYPEAAAVLNSVLAAAPGMDWTTVSNLYPSVDTYTQQLRQLEDFCRANRGDAAARFVLAYHYLVAGHGEEAADELEQVVKLKPADMVAKRLLEAIRPPAAEADPPAPAGDAAQSTPPAKVPETDLVGRWKAANGKETVELVITADSTFTWKAVNAGRPPVELGGTVETAADAIRLESDTAGAMVGKVASKGSDAFEFSLPGAPADVKPLLFERQAS